MQVIAVEQLIRQEFVNKVSLVCLCMPACLRACRCVSQCVSCPLTGGTFGAPPQRIRYERCLVGSAAWYAVLLEANT